MAVRDEISNLEDIILAILLRNPELVLSEPLDLQLFTRWKHVIHAMVKLSGRGIEPDIFVISDEVGENLIPTLGYLAKDQPGAKDNYKLYLGMLKSKVTDLRMFERLREGMKQIAEGSPSAAVIGQIVTESLKVLSTSSERQYSYTSKEMMKIMVDKLEEIQDSSEKSQGVKTGIYKIDEALGALHKSDLCIVGARPAVGKTAFGVTVMLNAAKEGKSVGFISTEMSVDQIAFRITAQSANIDAKKFRKVDFDDYEWPRLTAASQLIASQKIRICDKTVMTASDVMLQARAWDLDGGLDLLIVDYLTRIKPDKSVNNQNLDIGEVVTQMKNVARDLKIPVIVLAQLNRGVTSRSDSKPRMSDLRDSGIIEQEADCILLLHRETEVDEHGNEKTSASIIIDKNRHGECGEADVEFDGPTMRWFCVDECGYE